MAPTHAPSGAADAPEVAPQSAVADAVPERPALAPGVELVGEMPDTGFQDRQWLVQRHGQFIQVTELLFRIAEQADGARTLDEIAERVTATTDWLVTGSDVRHLIEQRLLPIGLIVGPAGAETSAEITAARAEARSPYAIHMRMKTIGPRVIDPITRVLQYLFAPAVLVPMLVLIGVAHVWLYKVRGLVGALVDAIYAPASLLVLFIAVVVAGVFHEFGHASALRYGGGRVRSMGAGFFLVFPALFTDVTDSYRLGRWARVRTGLGGVYFHLIFAVALMGIALVTGHEFLLVAVLLINIEAIRQFIPFVRLDGYWVITDLTGVPDFVSQTGPFLRSVLPLPGTGPKLPKLKPWVARVFAAYLILTIPALVALVFLLVQRAPSLLTLMWDATKTQVDFLTDAGGRGDVVGVATAASQLLILGLSVLGLVYMGYLLTWKLLRASLRQASPRRRLAGVLAVAGLIAFVAALWIPAFAGGGTPAGVEEFDVSERRHVKPPIRYAQSPPVGGNHAAVWQNCGFYPTPVPNANAVHSLEHGAVWITYRPDLAKSAVNELRALTDDSHVLVSPYPGQQQPVVATSWGRQLRLTSASDARLARYVQAFRLDSRAPESGGPCTGGNGVPR